MATTRDGHQTKGRPGEQLGWTGRTLIYIHLVEQVHNMVLSPRLPKRRERANYTNITWGILHTGTHVM